MQDSAYMVGVPFLCPDTPHLKKTPVFLYSYDRFKLPTRFRPDIVVSIDSVIDKKVLALVDMESQFVEGGATGDPARIPSSPQQRKLARERVGQSFKSRFTRIADNCRAKLIELYGEEQGRKVTYAEAFEICEYGRQLTRQDILELFPFFPSED